MVFYLPSKSWRGDELQLSKLVLNPYFAKFLHLQHIENMLMSTCFIFDFFMKFET